MTAPLDKSEATSRQLLFSAAAFIQSSSLLSSFVMVLTGRESWISALLGLCISLLLVWAYTALVKRYPGKNLFGILAAVFGEPLGRLFSFFYVFFFLSMVAVGANDVSGFVVDYIMPQTPQVVIVLTFLFVCGWAARKGAGGICRMGFLFFLLAVAVTLVNILLLAKDMQLSNFLPVFQLPIGRYLQGGFVVASVPLGEVLVFLMFAPNLEAGGGFRRPMFIGLALGAATLLTVILRNVAVLGNLASVASLPSYEAVRHIKLAEVITRVDLLYALTMLFLQFFKTAIYFYAAALGLAQVFRLRDYKYLLPAMGALAAAYAFILFGPSMENIYGGSRVLPVFAAVFEGVLPLFTLLAAFLRRGGRMRRKEALA